MRPSERSHPTLLPRTIILATAVLCSYAYFYEAGGWNQNTRFDLTRAIVERGTLRIDAYEQNTGDKARVGDHVYADKAPGASFTAVPIVMALHAAIVREAGALSARSPDAVTWLSYAANLAAAAFPAAIGVVCLFRLSVFLGATEGAAAVSAVALGLGTPLWAYAIILYGHALATGGLMVAFAAACLLREDRAPSQDKTLGAIVGVAAGWAVVSDFPSAVPASLIAMLALWHARTGGNRRIVRVAVPLIVGALTCAAVLMTYQWKAFGSPFHLGYESEEQFEVMRTGFFGITVPKLDVLPELLWRPYRGLLPLAPILTFAPIGFWFLLRRRETRAAALTAATIVVFYVLLNAGYAYWEGGWSFGPRHLSPSLPFLCLGIPPLWTAVRRELRAGLVVVVLLSVGITLVGVSTTAQPPADFSKPMEQLLWPAFRDGLLSLNRQSILDLRPEGGAGEILERNVPRAAWNLGQKLGLPGRASLTPLLTLWLLSLAAWGWTLRSQDGDS